MTKRALDDQRKEERRAEILALANRLLGERGYDEIRMVDIAAELGLAKGTLYLYFPSKESLFLALVSEGLEEAFGAVLERMGAAGATASPVEALATELAARLADQPALPRLLSLVHPVLEHKVAWSEAVAFKRKLADFVVTSGARLAAVVPGLGEEGGRRFFLYLYAQIVGLVQLTDVSPFMARIGAEPGLELFRLRLEATLRDSARVILAGLLAPTETRP